MASKVAGELYYDIDGQLSEIKRQLRQPNGYPFDPRILKLHLQDAIEGRFGNNAEPASSFTYDKRKDGWKLLENSPRSITSVKDVEAVPFLRPGENSVGGEEMFRRARVELGTNLSQEDGEWLLEHQNEIPAELRPFYLVLTGTVWQGPGGDRDVAYLDWGGGRWHLYWSWLGDGDWDSDSRVLRLRKPA